MMIMIIMISMTLLNRLTSTTP